MKTVPAMTIKSAWRGVPRITSAPKREMSYLLVMLVAISTKQQERPKLKGQTEFFRPQATRSSTRERMRVRRMASSTNPSVCSAWGEPGRLIDQPIITVRLLIQLLTQHSSTSLFPIERTDAPQIHKGGEQHHNKERHLCVTFPSGFTNGDGPCKQKNCFKIEYDEKHCDEIKLGREAHARGTFRQDAGFIG